MASSIVKFWRQLIGAVHPADVDVLAAAPGLFNLDYPPPAYVGDVDNARVILLNGNGGYKPAITPLEFPDKASIERAIIRLHYPAPIEPSDVSEYYSNANYSHWLKSGEMAMVNAVAYRAPEITESVRRIAGGLPSTQIHIQWLMGEVIPAAATGQRLIIAHRNGMWNLNRNIEFSGVHFTSNPRSKSLSRETVTAIEVFLTRPV
jgi:hypothetical protein